MFADESGVIRRALVTLPLPDKGTRAVFHPSYSHGGVVGPPELTKVRRAAMLALREISGHPAAAKGGQIEIISDVPRGVGMGSSTSDVTATIRAVADYHGVALSKEVLARLAVLAECASDSIMIDDRVVLFAHRDGVVLETFGNRLPPMIVVGCDTAPGVRVDTLRLRPADYDRAELCAFGALRAALRRAVALGDATLLGRVATSSARINQHYLSKPGLETLLECALRHGGCGIQVAHSGTVAGLIFDANRAGAGQRAAECGAELVKSGFAVTGIIDVAAAAAANAPAAMTGPVIGSAVGVGVSA